MGEAKELAARLDEAGRAEAAAWGCSGSESTPIGALCWEAAAALRDQAEELDARREDDKALAAYFEFHGAEHELDGCPEDDTCRCQCSAIGKRMRALDAIRARKGRMT